MEQERVFTSTGAKFLNHPDEVALFMRTGKATPISLQLAPTSRCNLQCVFCSNVNRDKHEDLDLVDVCKLLDDLCEVGLKTVEWTGGGDPTMYHSINEAIRYARNRGLLQGFITNGLEIGRLTEESLDHLHWLRVSMNCLDYSDEVDIPKIRGTLGLSYVMNSGTTQETLDRLEEHVRRFKPRYVRIVPNCQATDEDQEKNNLELSEMVTRWGSPYFYQAKRFSRPARCWWGWFKPFVLHDGWVYPCSSVVLNPDAERKFNEKYRWVRMENLAKAYSLKAEPVSTEHCSHCVFRSQNEMVDGLANPNGMEMFI